ncbi:MAG: DUF5011 domain-containing protein [Pseudomonadales bacterium]|nr:DUF5011 domain-containing protein [Pseudomonadales bacterium]
MNTLIAHCNSFNKALIFSALLVFLSACGGGGGDEGTDDRSGSIDEADTDAPIITLKGSNPAQVEAGDVYIDLGASASDNVDGDLTGAMTVGSGVNANLPGSYTMTYRVKDAAGNEAITTRTVDVRDTTAPIISLLGGRSQRVQLLSSYTDQGATATDNIDGNISGSIAVSSDVDASKLGLYTVTYRVSDAAGNTAVANRSVEVFNILPTSLYQAAWNGGEYKFGHRSAPNLVITGAPEDTDRSRWAMLHDGITYRLYFFKLGSNDTLYQFAFNPSSNDYEPTSTLTITGMPADADPSTFAMLHDGARHRLYMKSKNNPALLYQAAWTGAVYQYDFDSIGNIPITGRPADTDLGRWGMLFDGTTYRFYAFKNGSKTNFYQFAFDAITKSYKYGHLSTPEVTVTGMPSNSDDSDFGMLHDGVDYRFYMQEKPEL